MAAPRNKSVWKEIGEFASLVIMLVASTVTGLLIGKALDLWLGTTFLYIVFLLIGIAAGFVEFIRVVSRNSS